MGLKVDEHSLVAIDPQLIAAKYRKYERVTPPVDETVHVKTNSGFYKVLDISEGGVALLAPGMALNQRIMGVLRLPGGKKTIKVSMIVKNQRPNGSCGAEFEILDDDARNEIKAFVTAHGENPDSSVEFKMDESVLAEAV